MQTVRLGRVLLVAAVSALIPLAGNVVASVLTDWTGRAGWLVVPAIGVAVAMITALLEAYGSGPDASPQQRERDGSRGDVYPGSSPSQERRGTPLVVALVISVVVIGIGGLAVAEGTRSLITEADLPEGYEAVRSERFSSPRRCASLSALPGAPRSLRKTLSALGLKRCEWVQYEIETTSGNHRPGTLTFVLRDEQAASEFLPVLRRLVLATMEPVGDVVLRRRSFPAPSLGDEALRGLKVTISPDPDFKRKSTAWLYFWRRGDVVASAGAADAVGDFDRLSTLDLARAVDARIAD